MKIRTGALLAMFVFPLLVIIPRAIYADEARDGECPKHLKHRDSVEVLNSHLVAFQAGDAKILACDYADDAVFILPGLLQGGIAQGRSNIEAVFASLLSQAGKPIAVTVRTATISGDVALLEYQITSAHVVVTDGVDTFVIEDGYIVDHTAHLGGLSFVP